MNADMFSKRLAFGQIAESSIEVWLRWRCKYAILPVYEGGRNNKGPRLFLPNTALVAPDMLAIRGTDTKWVESKHKSHFTWHRKTQRWVTGIDLYVYRHYLQVAAQSPWPVWLLFLHSQQHTTEGDGSCPTGLFGGNIVELSKCENHRWVPAGQNNYSKSGMVYWAKESLTKLAAFEEVQGTLAEFGKAYGYAMQSTIDTVSDLETAPAA